MPYLNGYGIMNAPSPEAARTARLLDGAPLDLHRDLGVASHLHRADRLDRRGEGVPIILARSEALSGRLPEYRVIDQSELLLTIHAAGGIEERE